MLVGIKNIHGNFSWKRPITKKVVCYATTDCTLLVWTECCSLDLAKDICEEIAQLNEFLLDFQKLLIQGSGVILCVHQWFMLQIDPFPKSSARYE